LKAKLEGRYFGTIELMAAELQAVLDTLTEHDFQDSLKEWLVGSKVFFFAAPVPKIMDTLS
jgi:hypothetical protein